MVTDPTTPAALPAPRRPRAYLRVALVLLGSLLAFAAGPPTAGADGSATLSNLGRDAQGVVSGVLTVPATDGQVALDTSSLRLFVGGNQYAVSTESAASVQRSVVILIDRSGSMTAAGMQAVRGAVDQFVNQVPADVKVGVVSFADQVTVDVEPTQDRAAVRSAVAGLKSDGDTRLNEAVVTALSTLGTTGERSILLLSDGANNLPGPSDSDRDQAIRASGVRTQVVAFRTQSTSDLALSYVAAAGQGTVQPVSDPQGLANQFSAVARTLDGQVTWRVKVGADLHGAQTLTLRGRAAGKPFSAVGALDFPAAAPTPEAAATPTPTAAAPPPQAAPVATEPPSTTLGLASPVVLGAVAIFLGIALLVLALLSPAFKSARRERVEAVDLYVGPAAGRTTAITRTPSVGSLGTITEQLAQLGDRVVEGHEWTSKTLRLLRRADLPWRPGEWAVLRAVSVVLGTVLGALILHDDWYLLAGLFLGALAGVVIPPLVLRFLASRRARKFEAQLPDVLMMIASSLSTGFSLPQSLDAVGRDMAEPAAKEFSRAMAETRIGSDLEVSLMRMSERMGSENMRLASMAIEIQRRVGGNLAETLQMTARTLRERESLFRHVRSLSAEGRLSAWILILLPIGLCLYMFKVNNAYISLLWHSPLGIAMSVGALLLMAVGVFWMRRVVEVKV